MHLTEDATAAFALRVAGPPDVDGLGRVMFDAIHAVPSPYDAAERNAWCTAPPAGAGWQDRLAAQHVVCAEIPGAGVQGFATLTPAGEIDLAFLRPVLRGTGAFRALITAIEAEARANGHTQLSTFASLGAQGPFAACGFSLIHHERVLRRGQSLRRALMRKHLETARAAVQS